MFDQSELSHQRLLTEIFYSVDGEFEGPCPPMNSMLSLGAVAFTLEKGIIGKYTCNFETLPGSIMDPDTQSFWDKYPEQYAACRTNLVSPRNGMWGFARFIEEISGESSPVFTSWPGGVDFVFTYWYFVNFIGFSPFKWQAHDFKSYASAILKTSYKETSWPDLPERWRVPNPLEHIALNDAENQAITTIKGMCEHLGIESPV